MGLFYQFPNSFEESDRVQIDGEKVILKSYGPSYLFWGYFLAGLIVILAMALVVKGPVLKMIQGEDVINYYLALASMATIILVPLASLFFLLYEKRITITPRQLIIGHYILSFPFFQSKNLLNQPKINFIIEKKFDSPNVAKIKSDPELRGFENKGYFQLSACLETGNGKKIMVDRSNNKSDLKKIQKLLTLKNEVSRI